MKFDPDAVHTLVLKIGTSLLSGRLAFEGQVMESVVKELCALKKQHNINVLLVSSGAVGCGMKTLNLTHRPEALPEKQAVAAVGQATLMHYYETLFLTYGEGLHTAQVLLTLRDLDQRDSYLNVRNTIQNLFRMENVIPIVNENDSTAIEQLRLGDNDTLAAKIAAKLSAGLLIILSDVDGMYAGNPKENPEVSHIPVVTEITRAIEEYAGGAGTQNGIGGMRTKVDAARIAMAAGVPTIIADGHTPNIVQSVLAGSARCTRFEPGEAALSQRKRWIAFARRVSGTLQVDAGACDAILTHGKSLLPAGITSSKGVYREGDAVEICDPGGVLIARALVNYSSEDVTKIMGHRSQEIAAILGDKAHDEVVHRDNLVLI
ncbi:MAG: glutamate 5-kinase [Candidatus Hydrogenedentes bacterium]|nr:glutamate 5-kinase [Candidatus Hydrogenedentota bacterium]